MGSPFSFFILLNSIWVKNVPEFGLSWILAFPQQHFQGQISSEVQNNKSCPFLSAEILGQTMKCSLVPLLLLHPSSSLEWDFPSKASQSLHLGYKALQSAHSLCAVWTLRRGSCRDVWLDLRYWDARTLPTHPLYNHVVLCFWPLGSVGCPRSLFHGTFYISVMSPPIKWFFDVCTVLTFGGKFPAVAAGQLQF